MKKILAAIMSVGIAFSAVCCSVFAEDEIYLTVSDAEGKIGDEVSVVISLENNKGIAGYELELAFDERDLQPVGIKQKDAFSKKGFFSSNILEDGVDLSQYNTVTMIWADSSNCADNGEAAEVTFKIKNTALKTVPITVIINEEDCINDVFDNIPFKTKNAVVTVADGADERQESDNAPQGGGSVSGGNNESDKPDSNNGSDNSDIDSNKSNNEEKTDSQGKETAPVSVSGRFSDMSDHWAREYVNAMADYNIFKGYEDGTFRPGRGLTRQEMAVAVFKMLGLNMEEEKADSRTLFADDDKIAPWASDYVYALVNKGIFSGYADGTFGPDDVITREQLSLVLTKSLTDRPETLSPLSFTDAESVNPWAEEAVRTMLTLGIVSGYEDGTFKPQNTVTRAEACRMIYGFIEY